MNSSNYLGKGRGFGWVTSDRLRISWPLRAQSTSCLEWLAILFRCHSLTLLYANKSDYSIKDIHVFKSKKEGNFDPWLQFFSIQTKEFTLWITCANNFFFILRQQSSRSQNCTIFQQSNAHLIKTLPWNKSKRNITLKKSRFVQSQVSISGWIYRPLWKSVI